MTRTESRAVALREAVAFLTLRERASVTPTEPPRLPEVADVANRMEAYIIDGRFPLAADWSPVE